VSEDAERLASNVSKKKKNVSKKKKASAFRPNPDWHFRVLKDMHKTTNEVRVGTAEGKKRLKPFLLLAWVELI